MTKKKAGKVQSVAKIEDDADIEVTEAKDEAEAKDEDENEDEDEDEGEDEGLVPTWALPIVAYLPFLVVKCPFDKLHWAWSRLCTCGFGRLLNSKKEDGWHGGVFDLKHGNELQPCAHCHEDFSPINHQWHLSDEEEYILQAWRVYRAEMLDPFGKDTPFKWEIHVDLNGLKTFLVSRTQGLSNLTGTRGFFTGTKRDTDRKPN